MRYREYVRLAEDHPEVVDLTTPELYRRFWAYDIDRVKTARARVHLNRLVAPLRRMLDWLTRHLPKETP